MDSFHLQSILSLWTAVLHYETEFKKSFPVNILRVNCLLPIITLTLDLNEYLDAAENV